MMKTEKKLLEMLSYKRREGSVGQRLFNERFVQPIMGKPDATGNYICEVVNGKVLSVGISTQLQNRISFMAHHDTVHKSDGRQKVVYDPHRKFAYVDHDECLGADCTTGVWLILEMIKAKVPGLYIVHTGEECGGIGARSIVKLKPDWIEQLDFAISFDRYGKESIITHQSGSRCCSESFATDLESILNLNLVSDSTGTYTDSYEYMDYVSECTNLSVGYYNQHTKNEYQDIGFASLLLDRLVKADWSKLKPYRDPLVLEFDDWTPKPNSLYAATSSVYRSVYGFDDDKYYSDMIERSYDRQAKEDDIDTIMQKYNTMEKIIEAFPYEVAEILSEIGYAKRDLVVAILETNKF